MTIATTGLRVMSAVDFGRGRTKAMPFKSKAEQRYLFKNKPDVAKQFAQETPASAYQTLPQHVGDKPPAKKVTHHPGSSKKRHKS